MRILETYNEYNFTYYEVCDKLSLEYDRMSGEINANGHSFGAHTWQLDAGILLENNDRVIAGAFFNLSRASNIILIKAVFVEEEFRKQGIYTKLHSLIDRLGIEQNRTMIYSYIHVNNKLMQEHMIEHIGYEPILTLVSRPIRKG